MSAKNKLFALELQVLAEKMESYLADGDDTGSEGDNDACEEAVSYINLAIDQLRN